MDSTGFIEDIGTISSVVKSPSVGLAVAKSGRTTGFTTGNIVSINTSVTVLYPQSCNRGRGGMPVAYSNQIVVIGGGFSDSGDSGALIVTNDACHQPVGLLFASSATATIANPIGEALTKVGQALGKSVSFVGGACSLAAEGSTSPNVRQVRWPSKESVDYATAVMKGRLDELMALPAVIGVGIGATDEESSRAAIVIYVDATAHTPPILPSRIEDVAVKVILTDPFEAN